jgi:serine phosphatase RsbU (regulator of sigma subunit)
VRILPADAQSLGYRRSRPDFAFQNRELTLAPGTLCFLFTDGLLDQHGGRFNFGFGRRRLGRFLQDHRAMTMADLGRALAGALAAYQGGNAQRDDLTFLAFRME